MLEAVALDETVTEVDGVLARMRVHRRTCSRASGARRASAYGTGAARTRSARAHWGRPRLSRCAAGACGASAVLSRGDSRSAAGDELSGAQCRQERRAEPVETGTKLHRPNLARRAPARSPQNSGKMRHCSCSRPPRTERGGSLLTQFGTGPTWMAVDRVARRRFVREYTWILPLRAGREVGAVEATGISTCVIRTSARV